MKSFVNSLKCFAYSSYKEFDASRLSITTAPKVDVPEFGDDLVFGATFTPHMLTCAWDDVNGWGEVKIQPFENLSIPPQASVLHYGLECFEGMKAYEKDGEVLFFRPDKNMERFATSCERITLPSVDPTELFKAVAKHVEIDKEWIPKKKGFSLYMRPTMISMSEKLGVKAADKALFFNILSPVGPYFKEGFNPVKLLVDTHYARAAKGGTGSYKIGGNYAPTILPQKMAAEKGYSQLLWVGMDDGIVQEVGTMNFFVYWENEDGVDEVVTCPIGEGLILPGVTRASCIELCKEKGVNVQEKTFTITELIKAMKEKRVKECFGTGTAAVICPVESITVDDETYEVPAPSDGLTVELFEELLAIQNGLKEHEFCVKLSEVL